MNSEFVERYQLELSKNPRSRVFAALAEAYRKMGLLDEAKRICRFGTQAHPDFAGGHVAYAKVLLDSKAPAEALPHLEKATQLSPDNLLAHNLLGETLIQLRRPKQALKAFKMVLFLDPNNTRAKEAVKKWEFLTADEYSEDVFAMKPIFQNPLAHAQAEIGETVTRPDQAIDLDDELEDLLSETEPTQTTTKTDARLDLQRRHAKALERAVSLADAFTVRNDLEAALKVLEDAKRLLGPMAEIDRRHKLITKRLEAFAADAADDEPDNDTNDDTDDAANENGDHIESSSSGRTEQAPDENPALEMAAPEELAFEPAHLPAERKRQVLETLLRRINTRRDLSAG